LIVTSARSWSSVSLGGGGGGGGTTGVTAESGTMKYGV
jgi:hypothetical protein